MGSSTRGYYYPVGFIDRTYSISTRAPFVVLVSVRSFGAMSVLAELRTKLVLKSKTKPLLGLGQPEEY